MNYRLLTRAVQPDAPIFQKRDREGASEKP
jgi:hypothetical protein